MIQDFPLREDTLGTLSPLCPGKTMPGTPTLDIPPVNRQDQEKVKTHIFLYAEDSIFFYNKKNRLTFFTNEHCIKNRNLKT